VLHRHGPVKVPGPPRHRATGTPLSTGAAQTTSGAPISKGEFKLGNGRYCFPLTVTDHASRYLLLCEPLNQPARTSPSLPSSTSSRSAAPPQAIRSDNGVPFASPKRPLQSLQTLAVVASASASPSSASSLATRSTTAATERMHLSAEEEALDQARCAAGGQA